MTEGTRERLEYLRSQIRAECISQGEVIELQGLADEIEPGDVELLEWAGVPEFPESNDYSAETYVSITASTREEAIRLMAEAEQRIDDALRGLDGVTFSTESTSPDYGIEQL